MLPEYIIKKLRCPSCHKGKIKIEHNNYKCQVCNELYPEESDVPNFIRFPKTEKGQSVISKNGEIEFRKKLVEQEILNEKVHFEGMPQNLKNLIRDWINPQIQDLNWIMNFLKIGIDDDILEVGSEYSYCTSHLYNRGYKSIGGDLSQDCLIKAPEIINRQLDLKKIPPLMAFDATNLPFENESFDYVFSFAFVHHFMDFDNLAAEIKRVLKKDGYFSFAWDPIIPIKFIYKKLEKKGLTATDFHEEAYGIHEGLYTINQYISSFKKHFKITFVNPWKRWNTGSPPSKIKKRLKVYHSLLKGSDGAGIIMQKK
jgi:SAM-dependent methyltransferase